VKPIEEMSLGEFAAFVCSYLREIRIEVILSGGGCVYIYTDNRYVSLDLDFIENPRTNRRRSREVLSRIGFSEEKRYFKHPNTRFFLEFPEGPITVGNEAVKDIIEMKFSTGTLMLHCPGAADRPEAIESDDAEASGPNRALIFNCGEGKCIQNESEHFVECVETGATPKTNAEDSIQGFRVIWRLYEAERSGTVAGLRGLGLGNYR
jgi:hypothetical protein